MTAAMAMPGNTAETFLIHFFGTGLADDRYVVERFGARADGDIVPAPAEVLAAKGRRGVLLSISGSAGRRPSWLAATLPGSAGVCIRCGNAHPRARFARRSRRWVATSPDDERPPPPADGANIDAGDFARAGSVGRCAGRDGGFGAVASP